MFKHLDRDQELFLPPSLRDFINEDDLVFTIIDIVDILDLTKLIERYKNLGQNAYHPRMMLALLFYAYTQGIFSSRKIAKQLNDSIRFMYLAGRQTPDYRTINEFRKNNVELLKDYFIQIVHICQTKGMTPLESVSIDGSKLHANASKKKNIHRDKLLEKYKQTEELIDQLLKNAEAADEEHENQAADDSPSVVDGQLNELNKKHKRLKKAIETLDAATNQSVFNFTDPDCRHQKNLGPGYNAQVAVDNASQVIVGIDVSSDANDINQLLPMIAETEATTRSHGLPKKVYADSGYANNSAFKELVDNLKHIEAYVPTRKQVNSKRNKNLKFDKNNFQYDPVSGNCHCPAGHQMRYWRRGRDKHKAPLISFVGVQCPDCQFKPQCTKAAYRNHQVYEEIYQIVKNMEDKLDSVFGHYAMKIRKQNVEPVFGHLKETIGFRRFMLRGFAKVKGEFALLCCAHNLKKLHKHKIRSRVAAVVAQIDSSFQQTLVFIADSYVFRANMQRKEYLFSHLCAFAF